MDKKASWKRDFHLLKKISQGDERAFEALYKTTSQKTFFYLLRRLGGKDLAEDVLAETYTQVWKSAKKFRGQSSAGTWIIGIARNMAMKALRKTGPTVSIEERSEPADENPSILETMDRTDFLAKAISRLSPDHREVLDLVFYCQMSYPEVSKTVGIPVNTVKTRVFHAKKRMGEIFRSMGITKNDI